MRIAGFARLTRNPRPVWPRPRLRLPPRAAVAALDFRRRPDRRTSCRARPAHVAAIIIHAFIRYSRIPFGSRIMTGLKFNASSTFGLYRPEPASRDATWYGTLGILAACLGLLVVSGIMG